MAEKFETLLMKHGEHGLQAILENWERHQGIRYTKPVSLEERWEHFLRATDTTVRAAA